jgi:hypothetical protein
MLTKDSRRGWHVLPANGQIARGPDPRPQVFDGIVLKAGYEEESVTVCTNGMHACTDVIDTLRFCTKEPGVKLCRVIVTGELDSESDKFAGRSRVVLAMVPFDSVLAAVVPKYIARVFEARLKHRSIRSTKAMRAFLAEPNEETLRQLGKRTRDTYVKDYTPANRCWALLGQKVSRGGYADVRRFTRSLNAEARKQIAKVI